MGWDILFLIIGALAGATFLAAFSEDAKAYRAALQNIRENEGGVCTEYETCQHRACHSSYASWAIADAALTRMPLGTAKASGWWECHRAGSMRRDIATAQQRVLLAAKLAASGAITDAEFKDAINDARAALGIGPVPYPEATLANPTGQA